MEDEIVLRLSLLFLINMVGCFLLEVAIGFVLLRLSYNMKISDGFGYLGSIPPLTDLSSHSVPFLFFLITQKRKTTWGTV